MTDRSLVSPSHTYNPVREIQRNRRIEELLLRKADRSALLAWTGMPMVQATGTNTAFPVPAGSTITKLPFNTILVDNPDMLNSSNLIQPVYDMSTMFFFRLRHAAASGGSVDMIVHGLVNGVVFETYGYTARLDDVFDLTDTFFPMLTAGDIFEIGVTHDHGSAVTIDMTKSKAVLLQLSANPAYLAGNERVP